MPEGLTSVPMPQWVRERLLGQSGTSGPSTSTYDPVEHERRRCQVTSHTGSVDFNIQQRLEKDAQAVTSRAGSEDFNDRRIWYVFDGWVTPHTGSEDFNGTGDCLIVSDKVASHTGAEI